LRHIVDVLRSNPNEVFLLDVSWDFAYDEDEPYTLSIYFTFELEPGDA